MIGTRDNLLRLNKPPHRPSANGYLAAPMSVWPHSDATWETD